MIDHLVGDSYEEMEARVFKYLLHEQPQTWESQLNQAEETGDQDNKQSGDWEETWNYQETLSLIHI